MDVKEEDILGDRINDHWYYVSKGRAMREFIGAMVAPLEVLDVGAGSGIFSRQLLDAGLCQRAVCVDPNYAHERTETHNRKPLRFVKTFNEQAPGLVLMMDVLEHVADDVALLKQYTSALPAGGRVFISVPAFQFLWSGHDVFLEHYRRYTIKTLEACVRKAALTPIKSCYFFGSLFPAIAVIRLIKKARLDSGEVEAKSDLKLYPNWLNSALIATHDVERWASLGVNRLFGLSAFCLAQNNEPMAATDAG
jgi:SAM-dependent methyltransferase